MNPRNPAVLAFLLTFVLSLSARADEEADKAQFGLGDDQSKDFCTLGKETDYQSSAGASWKNGCEANPLKYSELVWVKKMDANAFAQLAQAASTRRQIVTDLYQLFTTNPELSTIQDDSNRPYSQKVSKCLAKQDCLNSYKDIKELLDINPPVTGRTFPAWLSQEQASKMLPYVLISENEKLRGAKYKEMNVPLNEKERKSFCEKNADKCKEFEKNQSQIKTNKAVITALKDNKGLEDPGKFALFVENGRQGAMAGGAAEKSMISQWTASYTDDPSKPFKPMLPQRPDSAAPPPAPSGPRSTSQAVSDAAGNAWEWIAGTSAAGMAVVGGAWAWHKAKSKADEEILSEDKAAVSQNEYNGPKTAAEAERAATPTQIVAADLSPGELRVYQWSRGLYENSDFKEIQTYEEWFTTSNGQKAMGQDAHFSTDGDYKSLLHKVNRINTAH